MDTCVSVETSMESTGRLMMPNAQVCVLEIKLEIVEPSGITRSFPLVSVNKELATVKKYRT